jgi:hypothetical protein
VTPITEKGIVSIMDNINIGDRVTQARAMEGMRESEKYVGLRGVVHETFVDERGNVHAFVKCDPGQRLEEFWVPVRLLDHE